jgi:glycosyltransferase involved in cell wall biosynthesis
MNRIPCSVPILTFNRKPQLERLLPVVADAFEDVFLTDGGSTDGTIAYARSLGIRVEPQSADYAPRGPIEHFARAREHSWSLARFDWIYWIDSDEIPTPELIRKVRSVIEEDDPNAVHRFIRMAALPDGRIVKHAFFYPEYIPRLFHRTSGVRLADRPVHEKFVLPEGMRVADHPETFVAPWDEPRVLWERQSRYLAMDKGQTVPTWKYLLRWIILYNVRSLCGQCVRALRSTATGWLKRETSLPWRCNWLFFKYRLLRISEGIRAWRRGRKIYSA